MWQGWFLFGDLLACSWPSSSHAPTWSSLSGHLCRNILFFYKGTGHVGLASTAVSSSTSAASSNTSPFCFLGLGLQRDEFGRDVIQPQQGVTRMSQTATQTPRSAWNWDARAGLRQVGGLGAGLEGQGWNPLGSKRSESESGVQWSWKGMGKVNEVESRGKACSVPRRRPHVADAH